VRAQQARPARHLRRRGGAPQDEGLHGVFWVDGPAASPPSQPEKRGDASWSSRFVNPLLELGRQGRPAPSPTRGRRGSMRRAEQARAMGTTEPTPERFRGTFGSKGSLGPSRVRRVDVWAEDCGPLATESRRTSSICRVAERLYITVEDGVGAFCGSGCRAPAHDRPWRPMGRLARFGGGRQRTYRGRRPSPPSRHRARVEPFDLIVDVASFGEWDDAAAREVEHREPPRHRPAPSSAASPSADGCGRRARGCRARSARRRS
jgi:hypothetical protein